MAQREQPFFGARSTPIADENYIVARQSCRRLADASSHEVSRAFGSKFRLLQRNQLELSICFSFFRRSLGFAQLCAKRVVPFLQAATCRRAWSGSRPSKACASLADAKSAIRKTSRASARAGRSYSRMKAYLSFTIARHFRCGFSPSQAASAQLVGATQQQQQNRLFVRFFPGFPGMGRIS